MAQNNFNYGQAANNLPPGATGAMANQAKQGAYN